jgi:putative flippase GtrA
MAFRYTTVSLTATAVDFLLFLLFNTLHERFPAGLATLLSASGGALISWRLNYRWVFVHTAVKRRSAGQRYMLGVLLCIGLNVLAVIFFCDVMSLPRMLGRILAAIAVWLIIYWFNRRVVFKV